MTTITTTQTEPVTETYQEQLHQLAEKMSEYQAELVVSFIKTLFGLQD